MNTHPKNGSRTHILQSASEMKELDCWPGDIVELPSGDVLQYASDGNWFHVLQWGNDSSRKAG